jgi:hypothetical protein
MLARDAVASHTRHQAQSHREVSDQAQNQRALLEPLRAVQSPRHDDFAAPSPSSISRKEQRRIEEPSTDSNPVGPQDHASETGSQINDNLAMTAPKETSGSYQQNLAKVNDVDDMHRVI